MKIQRPAHSPAVSNTFDKARIGGVKAYDESFIQQCYSDIFWINFGINFEISARVPDWLSDSGFVLHVVKYL